MKKERRPIAVVYVRITDLGRNNERLLTFTRVALSKIIRKEEYITMVVPITEGDSRVELLSVEQVNINEFKDLFKKIEKAYYGPNGFIIRNEKT